MALIRANSKWQTVDLPPTAIKSDDEFKFLSSFEEIDDYEVVRPSNVLKQQKPRKDSVKQGKKEQISSQSNTSGSNEISQQKSEKILKSKKKAKTEKNLAQQASTGPDVISSKLKKKAKKKKKAGTENVKLEATTKKRKLEKIFEDLDSISDAHLNSEVSSACDLSGWQNLFVPKKVLSALKDLNFSEPTPIQQLCLPPAIRDKLDILGAAETGSGKTLAFGIPITEGLLNDNEKYSKREKNEHPRALILTPTRELAIQIKNHLTDILKYTPFKIAAVIGGLSLQKQERILKHKPEIVVGTPGRLWAFIERTNSGNYLGDLSNLQYLVIDETDRMAEKGHFEELSHILDHLKEKYPGQKRQTFVFSATLTFVHPPPKRLNVPQTKQLSPEEKIEALISMTGLRKKRKIIDITRTFGTAEKLTEARINCESLVEKDAALYYFLTRYPGRTLVFANSVDSTRRLYSLLGKLQLTPFLLHARMHQKQRLKNLERFTENERGVLLATDVAARGLDIRGIEHVVHYHVPRTAEIYVHRSGRTARASCVGLSVMLIDPNDAFFYRRIVNNLNREKDLPVFPVASQELYARLKERIGVASDAETLEHRVKRAAGKAHWFHRQAREADLQLEHDTIFNATATTTEEIEEMKQQMKNLQRKLNFMLKTPLPAENAIRTRYITADVVELSNKKPTNALGTLEERMDSSEVQKKRKVTGLKLKTKVKTRKERSRLRKRKKLRG